MHKLQLIKHYSRRPLPRYLVRNCKVLIVYSVNLNWNISKNHTWTYLKASKATKKEIFSECLKSKNSLTNFPYTQSTKNQTNILIEKWCISRGVAPRCPFQGSQLQRHSWKRLSKIQFKLLDITEEGFWLKKGSSPIQHQYECKQGVCYVKVLLYPMFFVWIFVYLCSPPQKFRAGVHKLYL